MDFLFSSVIYKQLNYFFLLNSTSIFIYTAADSTAKSSLFAQALI